jgi:hypothetical protein
MYCETSLYDADQLEEALAITEAYRVSKYVSIYLIYQYGS